VDEATKHVYDEPQWYACHTRARHEKRVESLLRERGFDSYLPTFPRIRQWKDRRKLVDWPLFPGYVFGRFAVGEMHRVVSIPGVATIVRTNGRPVPVRHEDLDNVRRFARGLAEVAVEPEVVAFVGVGEWVRVKAGPFEGVCGLVLERRTRRRVLVGVAAIGQGLEVDIDVRLLEPVERSQSAQGAAWPG
jgi:transcription termination/antitermination protein NusG